MELNPRRTVGRRIDDFENASNSISNSVAESDSVDAESGFEDQEIPDHGQVSLFFGGVYPVNIFLHWWWLYAYRTSSKS